MPQVRGVLQGGELRSARIESLRAIAALSVVAWHVAVVAGPGGSVSEPLRRLMSAGGLGVYLFFALTGYLLYLPFARRAFADGRSINIGIYARNRALRILPLYYATVIILLIVQEHGGSSSQWWQFVTFSENFFRGSVEGVDVPMWSLVVEVQFYVLLPLLAWGLSKLGGRSPVRAAALLAVIGAASLLVWWIRIHRLGPSLDTRWTYSLPATFFSFVPGMMLALLSVHLGPRARLRRPSSDVLLIAGFACWLLAAFDADRWGPPLLAVAASLIVGAAVLPLTTGWITRVLELRALVLIGVVSYSLYIWHFPITSALYGDTGWGFGGLLPIAAAASICVAVASYALVERPFLRMRLRWGSTAASQLDGRAATPQNSTL
jgi:peptidoglycan/LPS O-acetylase OafA/YrhL